MRTIAGGCHSRRRQVPEFVRLGTPAGEREAPMNDYNYAVFDLQKENVHFASFKQQLHVGEHAPDAPLERLDDGETTPMSALWANGPAVIEFGSFT
jgi:hypothetical protein